MLYHSTYLGHSDICHASIISAGLVYLHVLPFTYYSGHCAGASIYIILAGPAPAVTRTSLPVPAY